MNSLPTELLADVFAFLANLQSENLAPSRQRFLPLSALLTLNPHLLVPDPIQVTQRVRGVRGTTECTTQRIRFVHFLCEAADLVARADQFLKPTPRAHTWLAQSAAARAESLFTALRADPTRDLWRIYHFRAPREALDQLLDLLIHSPRHPVPFATLLRLIPLPTWDEPPRVRLHDLLRALAWLGILESTSSRAIGLTDWGAHLLHLADAAPGAPGPTTRLTLRAPRGDTIMVVAPRDDALTAQFELSAYAAMLPLDANDRARATRRYQLTPARLRRALAQGDSLARIFHSLETLTRDALSARVVARLNEWACGNTAFTLEHATLLTVRDSAQLTALARDRCARQCIAQTLSPRAVILRPARIDALIRHLERQGITPRVQFARAAAAPRPVRDSIDLHLYIAARLGYEFPTPLSYRVPHSILAALETRLTPTDRARAEQIFTDLVAAHPTPTRAVESPADVHSASDHLAALERAIANGTALRITYYTATRDATTTRTIEPLRLEWRRQIPYLIAYCRLRQDERVFRVSRILELHPVNLSD
jgi:hypothetical protein